MNHDPNSPNTNYPRFGTQEPQQYGLQNFDVPPSRQSAIESALGPTIIEKLTNPLVATSALVVAGVLIAGVMFTFSGSEDAGEPPIVVAENVLYKDIPEDAGDVLITGADSTVFSSIEGDEMPEGAPLENLLAEDSDTGELAAFAREVEQVIEESGADAGASEAEEIKNDVATIAAAETKEAAPVEIKKIANKVETVPVETVIEKPVIQHKAGENPETLEFVRSVLEKKDNGGAGSASDVATRANEVATIKPAAGDAGRAVSVTPGSYYIQLGSVKSLAGAEAEWGKIKDAFTAELGSLPHRVESADLGERGMFYRIQAGPVSKQSATEICESIKAQKPGGCLVTQ